MERVNQNAKSSSQGLNECMTNKQILEMPTDNNVESGSLYKSFKFALSPAFLEQVDLSINTSQVLILVSTRELAKEIQQVVKELVDTRKLNCHAFVDCSREEMRSLEDACHIAIGTPGSLLNAIKCKAIQTNTINLFVLHEFEEFMGSSLVEQMLSLIAILPTDVLVVLLPQNRFMELTKLKNAFETAKISVTKLMKNNSRTKNVSRKENEAATGGQLKSLDCKTLEDNIIKCAFSFDLLEQIDISINICQILILASTRELAKQIHNVVKELSGPLKLDCQVCVGGTDIREEIKSFEAPYHIVVGTTGRLLDMIDRNALQINKIKFFILFEFENFLRSTFEEAMPKLIAKLPSDASVILLPENRSIDLTKLKNDFEAKISKKVAKQNAKLSTNNSIIKNISRNENIEANGGQLETLNCKMFEDNIIKCVFSPDVLEQIDMSIDICQILILVSRRKLAEQIQEVIKKLADPMELNCQACIGGTDIPEKMQSFEAPYHIVVATPGRLLDMIDRNAMQINEIKLFILLELENFLTSTFEKPMRKLIDKLPSNASVILLPENRSIKLTNLRNDFDARISNKENVSGNENKEVTVGQLEYNSIKYAFSPALLKEIDVSINICQILILASTRELAKKIQQVIKELVDTTNINCHAYYGGTNINDDQLTLESACHIVVGTPGRVLDMINRKGLQTNKINILALFESKKIINKFFEQQILNLIDALPSCASVILLPENNMMKLTNFKTKMSATVAKQNAKLKKNNSTTENVSQNESNEATGGQVQLMDCKPFDNNSFKCAFSPAVLEQIDISINTCQILILTSTRELAKEIQQVVKELVNPIQLNCHACYGGTDIHEEKRNLEAACHIVVGTVGRVLHMINHKAIQTNKIKIFVLYEFRKLTCCSSVIQMLDLIATLPPDASVIILPENRSIELTNLKNDVVAKISARVAKLNETLLKKYSIAEPFKRTFPLALLEKIDVSINTCQILILSPTRKTARRIKNVVEELAGSMKLDRNICVRGKMRCLEAPYHIVVGTSSRLLDMINNKAMQTNTINIFVLHEFEKIRKGSFEKDVLNVVAKLPSDVSIILLPESRSIELTNLKNDFEAQISERTAKRNAKLMTKNSTAENVSRNENRKANARQQKLIDKSFKCALSPALMEYIDISINTCQILIFAHSHANAKRIQNVIKKLADPMKFNCYVCVREETQSLEAPYHIVVGTPVRLFAMIINKTLQIHELKLFILPEFENYLKSYYGKSMSKLIAALPSDASVILLPENRLMNLTNLRNEFEAKISANVLKPNAKLKKNDSITKNVSRDENKEATDDQLECLDCKTFEEQLVLGDNAVEKSFINYINTAGIMQQIEVANNSCQVLILASKHQLVIQIQQIIKKFIISMKLECHNNDSDTNIREEILKLEAGFHIIVATPDCVSDIGSLNVCKIKHLIFYEFPKCLSSTDQDKMRYVINSLPANIKVFLLPENRSSELVNLKNALKDFRSTGSESAMDVKTEKNHSAN